MSLYPGIEIYSLDDIIINTVVGKNVVLNGIVFAGNGVGIKADNYKERLVANPQPVYSTEDIIIRTAVGKKVSINGTDYVSTTGIARQQKDITRYYPQGFQWYSTDNIIIQSAKKIIINDVEVAAGPPVTSGLAAWYDASDTASITSSAGAVSQWNDKSVANRHMVQATAANKPNTGTVTQNGKNVLKFTGNGVAGHFLQYTGNTTLNVGSCTFFTVISNTTWVQYAGILTAFTSGVRDDSSLQSFHFNADGTFIVRNNIQTTNLETTHPSKVYCGVFDSGAVTLYRDGVLEKTQAGTGAFGVATGGYMIGTRYLPGQQYFFDGTFAEIITYDRIVTLQERQQVEGYLKTKWGTP